MKSGSISLTGATGFVGGHLAEAFRAAGWDVHAIVRPDSRHALPDRIASTHVSLDDADALARAFDGRDVVVHCAGVIRARDQQAFDAVNVAGTRAVVAAANRTGAKLMLISSLAAGGVGTPAAPRRETDPDAPVNAYGRSKLGGEVVVRTESRTPWTILRPCAVYGVRDRGFLPLHQMATRGWFVRPTAGNMAFTLIDVADLARAAVLAAASERAVGETMFIGHAAPKTTDEILRTLADIYGRPYTPFALPRALVYAAASFGDLAWKTGRKFVFDSGRLAEFRADGFVCAVDRARELLGFVAGVPMEEGFRRAADWYRQASWI